jgi:hypothetical protein
LFYPGISILHNNSLRLPHEFFKPEDEMKKVGTVLLFAILFTFPCAIFAFEPLFDARIDYGAGDGPQSVFAADLDGDGDSDLAVANYNSDNVSILKNLSNNGPTGFSYLPGDVNMSAGAWPPAAIGADVTFLVNFFRGLAAT